MMYHAGLCTRCRLCMKVCPRNAIYMQDAKVVTDRQRCNNCGECGKVCASKARELCGQISDVGEIMEKVRSDKMFFEGSGGGVTVSGGEPLLQWEFTLNILKACKNEGIHTAIETSGFALWEHAKEVFKYSDLILYDLKHMDSEIHRKLCGVPNEAILQNAIRAGKELGSSIVFRMPVIPGYNDDEENISSMVGFLRNEMGGKCPVYLLPYHNFGEEKRDSLDVREWEFYTHVPDEREMESLAEKFSLAGIEVHIGGSM